MAKDQGGSYLSLLRPYNVHADWVIEKEKAALLIIDMQNYFVHPKGASYLGDDIISNVKRLAEAFRKAKVPVIFTQHGHEEDGSDLGMLGEWWGDGIVKGSWDHEIMDEISPGVDDHIVRKNRYSAFANTDLESILSGKGVKDVIISGVLTNMCCETTAREAFVRDHRVFFLADGTMTSNEEMHLSTLRNMAYAFAVVKTVDQVIDEISK